MSEFFVCADCKHAQRIYDDEIIETSLCCGAPEIACKHENADWQEEGVSWLWYCPDCDAEYLDA
jgi:hypothetical protein